MQAETLTGPARMSVQSPASWLSPEVQTDASRENLPAGIDRLSSALYAVQEMCPTIPILSIYWIQIQHPIYPVQEKIIQECGVSPAAAKLPLYRRLAKTFSSAIAAACRFGVCVKRAWILNARLLHLRYNLRHEIAGLRRERFDVVAKTWCFKPEVPGNGMDFYYGDLQRRLADRSRPMLLLCGDARHTEAFDFARVHMSSTVPHRMPENALLPPLSPFLMVLWQMWTSIKLLWLAFVQKDPWIRSICKFAAGEVLSHQSMLNGLNFWIGRGVSKFWRPRAVLTLYEGRSNERCFWRGVKSIDPSCKIVGYQHTFIFPSSLSLTRPSLDMRASSAPDVVLCLGDRSRKMMQAGHQVHKSRLISFGTFRRNADNERTSQPRPEKQTILVLPQGFLWEAKILFDFSMRLAERMPGHHFILRCHPFMPFSWVRPHLSSAPEDYPNIEISPVGDFDADVGRSSVALYMGSSSVVYTILRGLLPVHLRATGHPDEDPLHDLEIWRRVVSNVEEAKELMMRYPAADVEQTLSNWTESVAYVNRCTAPVDETSISRFLSAIELETPDRMRTP